MLCQHNSVCSAIYSSIPHVAEVCIAATNISYYPARVKQSVCTSVVVVVVVVVIVSMKIATLGDLGI